MPPRLWPNWKPSSNESSMKNKPAPAAEIDVNYVAHLARLSLTPEETQKFETQLANVLGYIEKLRQVDVSGIEPTAHAFPLVNVTRQDQLEPSLEHEEALRNAPAKANGLFMVPKIVE
jgi:aspartyl-tRNA(Asn)/glutamyl-tRNA(Gln) amidotransferase subunit C